MGSHHLQSDYATALKILSEMSTTKPTSLVAVSQKTGVKLAEVIRFCTHLINENVISRAIENGNIYYTLKNNHYENRIREIYGPPPEDPEQKKSAEEKNTMRESSTSQTAIMRRRAQRASQAAEKAREKETPDDNAKKEEEIPHTPERISALDLVAIKRSSSSFQRVVDPNRMAGKFSSTSQSTNSRESSSGSRSSGFNPRQTRTTPAVDRGMSNSSTTHKAVYINKQTPRHQDNYRSSFAMPPSQFDTGNMERSDGIFKNINPDARRQQTSIIPEYALSVSNNDIPKNEIFETLGIPLDKPLIAILSPRPSHELWASCSALVNSGGGYIVLGLRKYVKDDVVTYYIKSVANPEESTKTLIRQFNDRNIISDSPKDVDFISTHEIHKKNILLLNLDPSFFSPAPLYTARDSFGMKTKEGCYLLIKDEVVHCTEEDVKNLWIQRRLGRDLPDWHQTGEILDTPMSRNIKLHLPSPTDDAVRPLSRKVSTYGMPLNSCETHLPPRTHQYPKPQKDKTGRIIDQSTKPYASLQNIQELYNHTAENHAQNLPFGKHIEDPRIQTNALNASSTTQNIQADNTSNIIPNTIQPELPLGYAVDMDNPELPSKRKTPAVATPPHSTVESLLFAEDFSLSPHVKPSSIEEIQQAMQQKLLEKKAPEEQSQIADPATPPTKTARRRSIKKTAAQNSKDCIKPEIIEALKNETHSHAANNAAQSSLPLFANANRSELDEIAKPVLEYTRLPMLRVCEISARLCKQARFTIKELATVLGKKPAVVKDKILPYLRELPNFIEEDNIFYISKS